MTANNDTVVERFNHYLKAIKLDTLVKATNLSFFPRFSQQGSSGITTLNTVHVLTLEPGDTFSPMKFIGSWDATINKLNKDAIYTNLFLELSVLSGLPPDSLAIKIGTSSNGLYSYLVYHNGTLKVNRPAAVIKGSTDPAVVIGPGDLNNSLYGGFFQNAPFNAALKDKLLKTIQTFLRGSNSKNANVPEPKKFGSGIAYFTATDKGRVTKKYYEGVILEFTIVPAVDQHHADVSFSFNIVYSSSPVDMGKYHSYENAITLNPIAVTQYGSNLKTAIQHAIYGNSN